MRLTDKDIKNIFDNVDEITLQKITGMGGGYQDVIGSNFIPENNPQTFEGDVTVRLMKPYIGYYGYNSVFDCLIQIEDEGGWDERVIVYAVDGIGNTKVKKKKIKYGMELCGWKLSQTNECVICEHAVTEYIFEQAYNEMIRSILEIKTEIDFETPRENCFELDEDQIDINQ